MTEEVDVLLLLLLLELLKVGGLPLPLFSLGGSDFGLRKEISTGI